MAHYSFIDWMQEIDEQEEQTNPAWKPLDGFPMGARSYWVADATRNRVGEAILFYKGDGRIFARLLVTVPISSEALRTMLQCLYDEFDYFKNLDCTVFQATDLGTYETLRTPGGTAS